MVAKWHHSGHKAPKCHFFTACLNVLPFSFDIGASQSDSPVKMYQIRAFDFGVQFSFRNVHNLQLVKATEAKYVASFFIILVLKTL